MILNFRTTFFTFSKGLQQKIDSNLLQPPYLLNCENAIFFKTGSVQMRNGYTHIGTLGEEVTSLTDFQDKNSTLIAQTENKVYSFSEDIEEFNELGDKKPFKFTHTEVVRNNYNNTNCDVTETTNFKVIVWETNQGTDPSVRYSIIDNNKTFIKFNQLVEADAQRPKVFTLGNHVWICYQSTDKSIKFRRLPISDPSNLLSATTVVDSSDVDELNVWDTSEVEEISSVVFTWNDAAGGIKVKYYNIRGVAGDGVSSNGLPTETSITSVNPSTVLRIFPATVDPSTVEHLVVYDDGSNNLEYTVVDFVLSSVVQDQTLEASVTSDRVAGAFDETAETWTLIYQDLGATVNENVIKKARIDFDGLLFLSPTIYKRGLSVYSDLQELDGSWYWWGLHESDTQPTYFLFEDIIDDGYYTESDGYVEDGYLDGYSDAILTAKHLQGLGGDAHDDNHVVSKVFPTVFNKKNKLQAEDGFVFSNEGVILLEKDEELNKSLIGQVGRTSILTGALTQTFDKHQVSEHGFSIFPEPLSATTTGSSGLADGTYLFTATYEWTDANGDTHESAPSEQLSVTVTGGPKSVEVDVPTNRITDKQGVVINLYRTTNGGTTFYKTTPSSTGFTFNDQTVDKVTITDDTDDSTLTGNPQLYTTGGVLDNIAPPMSEVAVQHKDRIFLAGDPDNPSKIWFSQIYTPGTGLQFNELLTVNVELGAGGPITALASLDDNLIIFKRNSIFYMPGIGPDFTGGNSDYNPQEIATDVGCVSPRSIVSTPYGIIFKSEKGIYALSRSFETTYVGAPVEDFNDSEVIASALLANDNAIKFALDTGEILYFNYYHSSWSVHTNYEPTAAAIKEDAQLLYHCSGEDGKIYKETDDYRDDGASIVMKIRTGWINFGSQLTTKRVRYAALLGDRLEDHNLTWKIYSDYSNVVDEKMIFDVRSGDSQYGAASTGWGSIPTYGVDTNAFGDQTTFGNDSFFGGSDNGVMAFRHKLGKQKVQAVSFELINESIAGIGGPALELTGFALDYAIKRSLKTPFKQSKTI